MKPGVASRARAKGPPLFGLIPREARTLRALRPAWRIQRFLDALEYDVAGEGCRSPRRVLRERTVQCMDGALFAAAALRLQGHPPLIVDLEAVEDDDHVIAVFRQGGLWGALARSNYSGLRYREPVFPNLRALVLSYFESYFNLRRQKTLRGYSVPFDLSRFDARNWMAAEEDLWYIPERLASLRHFPVLRNKGAAELGTVDRRMFEAGLLGWEGRSSSRGDRSGRRLVRLR